MAGKKKKKATKKKEVQKIKKPEFLDLFRYTAVYIDPDTGELLTVKDKSHSELTVLLDLVHPDDRVIFRGDQLELGSLLTYEQAKHDQHITDFLKLASMS